MIALAAAWKWVQGHRAIAGAALAVTLVAAGGLLAARCAPAPAKVEERQVTDGKRDASWGSTATMAKTVERHAAPTIRERFDPTHLDAQGRPALVERLTIGEVDTSTRTDAQREAGGQEHEQVHQETTRVVDPVPLLPRLQLSITGGWSVSDFRFRDLELRPVLRAEAELRLTDRLYLDVSYAPPLVNTPQHKHEIQAQLRLVVLRL